LHAVLEINRDSRRSFIRKLNRLLGTLEGATIALWGLAFKPETDDLREAPSLEVIRDLLARGAVLRAYDPVAMAATQALFPSITYCADPYEAATGADAVALITDWNEFKGVDFARVRDAMRRPVLLDGRNLYDPHEIAALGFTYCGVGVPSPPAASIFNPAMMQSVAD
jgi:UDPglucose 6-dehydrogenase